MRSLSEWPAASNCRVRAHTHIHTHTHTHTHTHVIERTAIRMEVPGACTHSHCIHSRVTPLHTYIRVCLYVHVCAYTYIHTYIQIDVIIWKKMKKIFYKKIPCKEMEKNSRSLQWGPLGVLSHDEKKHFV
jgi:hypothetical protein